MNLLRACLGRITSRIPPIVTRKIGVRANALARLTPACGPHHHAPGRSRAARDSHTELSRAARGLKPRRDTPTPFPIPARHRLMPRSGPRSVSVLVRHTADGSAPLAVWRTSSKGREIRKCVCACALILYGRTPRIVLLSPENIISQPSRSPLGPSTLLLVNLNLDRDKRPPFWRTLVSPVRDWTPVP